MDTPPDDRFTPGPWDAECTYSASIGLPLEDDQPVRVVMSSNPDQDVAYLLNGLGAVERANARLIAAAPDLLAACRQFQQWDEDPHSTEADASSLRRSIAAAIAKATDPTPFANEEASPTR